MRDQAIALCRISSKDQEDGHSLDAQNVSVSESANELNVDLVKVWTEVKTSKKGKNFGRRDMEEMLRFCKQHKQVKYLLIDFMNRLMREVEVMIYYKVLFNQMGVVLYFCSPSQRHLNGDDQVAQLMRLIEGYTSEIDNTARQNTTIARMKARYANGYYISHPHAGYIISETKGFHIPDPKRFELLQKGSSLIIKKGYTPKQAVRWMNDNGYKTLSGKTLDTSKYISFISDRYYCGIIDIQSEGWPKDVTGLHERMFSLREHGILVAILNKRNPRLRQVHNKEFPMANILRHLECIDLGKSDKLSGYLHNRGSRNGKPRPLVPVYDCRNCRKRYSKELVERAFSDYLSNMSLLPTEKRFKMALIKVWRDQRGSQSNRITTLKTNKYNLEHLIRDTAASYSQETNIVAKESLLMLLEDYKTQLNQIDSDIATTSSIEIESESFVKFAIDFALNIRQKWLSLSFENQQRGEQILFNGKIYIGNDEKVRTPNLSSIFRLGTNKNALVNTTNALMVELVGITPTSEGLS